VGNAKYKQRHRELGLCVDCSEPAYPENSRCLKHGRNRNAYTARHYLENLEHYQETYKRIKDNRIKDGRCAGCSAPLDPDADKDRVNCVNCRGGTVTERSIHGNTIV
jgi:protein-arginine kinase activator protein McsA